MAHDRVGTGRWVWLKGVGTAEEPLSRDWRYEDRHLLSTIWFTRYPRSVRGGDLLVYYASGWKQMPAIVEVLSDAVGDEAEEHPRHGQRFRWTMGVRPIVTVGFERAPTLRDTPIRSSRVKRISHMLLLPDEYEPIREMILGAARDESEWQITGRFPHPE